MSGTPWRELANCAGSAEPYLFDATIDDDGKERPDARAMRHALALQICRSCSVRDQCLAEALGERTEGVRGGVVLPPLKFQHLKHPERARTEIPHNTEAGFAAHKRRGVPVDPLDTCGCRGAARRAREQRERKAAS